MDLTAFADEIGSSGAVTIAGLGTRGGAVAAVRCVRAPAGIEWLQADEMTICCGAGTAVDDVQAALAEVGQFVALPPGGTVGGALAVGLSGIRRLGDGPVRDALLQAHYVGADGQVVKVGGPTVKNVSGFDVCRLLVGSRGTLGFVGDVILRTRPMATTSRWFRMPSGSDPFSARQRLYRPVSILWDGADTWVLLEGHASDIAEQVTALKLGETDGPPQRPSPYRWSLPSRQLRAVPSMSEGRFLVEVGVGVVHHESPPPRPTTDPAREVLEKRIRTAFDPAGRLNPGR